MIIGVDLLHCWHLYGLTLDGAHYYNYICYDNLWKSKFITAEKPGKLRDFSLPCSWLSRTVNKVFSAAVESVLE